MFSVLRQDDIHILAYTHTYARDMRHAISDKNDEISISMNFEFAFFLFFVRFSSIALQPYLLSISWASNQSQRPCRCRMKMQFDAIDLPLENVQCKMFSFCFLTFLRISLWPNFSLTNRWRNQIRNCTAA